MSTFAVKIERIKEVTSHPNADRLDIATVLDWQCVTAKGNFKPGDLCVYIPIDSILPSAVEEKIFGPDSKVRLTKSRVRTIKLRGAISQGMAIKPSLFNLPEKEGMDVTAQLGITKYEPPVKELPAGMQAPAAKKNNPHFKKFGGIENAKNYPDVFKEGEQVVITEKVHGSSFKAGWVPFYADRWWKKLLTWIGLAPKWEWVYGSNNVQLQNKWLYKGYYEKNIYAETVVKYDLKNKLQPSEVIYGEIYGDGIQKNYKYGCAQGEHRFVAFDIMVNGEYKDALSFYPLMHSKGLPTVPVLYTGAFNKEKVRELTKGDSVLCPEQKIREGVVVKPVTEQRCIFGRKMLKYISEDYLLRDDNTDFH